MKRKIYTGKTGNLLAQLDKLRRHNRQGSFKTKERYYDAMKRFCRFVSERFNLQKLANISEKHVVAYVEDMKTRELSPSTIKTELSAIRLWHDKIFDVRYEIPPNSELNLERRTFGGVDRAWKQIEFNRMLSVCCAHKREDYIAIFTLARYAGLRIHECFRIDTAIAENALKTGELTINGKGGKIRTFPINRSIEIELNIMLKVTERGHKLFVSENTKTHNAIEKLQQFIIAHKKEVQNSDSERPLTFHGLRHFCAVEWYLKLKSEGKTDFEAHKQVSLWLGHERDDVTKLYLASLPRAEGKL